MTKTAAKAADINEKTSFEDALSELEGIVRALESGATPLEESITAYERGILLKKHCEARLKDARLRVEKLTLDTNGKPTGETQPLDTDID